MKQSVFRRFLFPARPKLHSIFGLLLIAFLGYLPVGAALEAYTSPPPKVSPMKTLGGLKVIHGEVDIDTPPAIVWGVLSDYANIKRILPGYTRSAVVLSTPKEKRVDLTLKLNALTPELSYQVRFQEEHALNRILFQRISGDFDEMSGSYKLIALNNGTQTRLIYDLQIDFGVPIPGLGYLLRNKAEADLTAIQRYSAKNHLRSLATARTP